MGQTLYEELGGEGKLRQIIDTFIDRVFEDRMIGFFFRQADKGRIKEMEFQLTAGFLGADIQYRGRHENGCGGPGKICERQPRRSNRRN